jgi:hypothetical protein
MFGWTVVSTSQNTKVRLSSLIFSVQVDPTNALVAKETSLAERKKKKMDHLRDASQVQRLVRDVAC